MAGSLVPTTTSEPEAQAKVAVVSVLSVIAVWSAHAFAAGVICGRGTRPSKKPTASQAGSYTSLVREGSYLKRRVGVDG